jgi:hypothetical protein
LHAFLETRRRAPFCWGVNDCCLFVADGVLAMTGVDIAVGFRDKYHDESSCMALLKQMGYASVSAMVAAELQSWGFASVRPSFAQRGDIVAYDLAGVPALALVSLDGAYARGVGENGAAVLPVLKAVRAWRV